MGHKTTKEELLLSATQHVILGLYSEVLKILVKTFYRTVSATGLENMNLITQYGLRD